MVYTEGQMIGIFKVKKDLGSFVKGNQSRAKKWLLVVCPICNREFESTVGDMRRNKSCGCTRWDKSGSNKTHGDSRTKLHFMWMNMIGRVDKNEHYKGISLCDEWRNDYLVFKEFALNNGYKEGLSIDRINGSGDYEPNNIRFVTRQVQSANRAGDKKRKHKLPKGVYLDERKTKPYFSSITVDGKSFHLGSFKTVLGAVNAYNKFVADNNLQNHYPLSE